MPQYAASQLACPREPESSNDPYPPVLRHGLSPGRPAASRDQGPPGTQLGAVTHAYRGQLAEVEAIAAITAAH